VQHSTLGGLLHGSFTFTSTCPFGPSRPAPLAPRSLRHILGVAVRGGTPVVAPPTAPPGPHPFIEWGTILPALQPLVLVRCRSVFSPTQWTLRTLTARELLAVFDIPQQENALTMHYEEVEDLPFLHCAPIKALYYALTCWTPTAPSTRVPPTLPDPDCKPPAVAYPNLHFDQMEARAVDAVAVKADDAAVPTGLWDDRVWAGTWWSQSKRQLYEVRYGRGPLEAIRRLGLRTWRRNVRVSFIQYLKREYGSLWATCRAGLRDREVGRDCLWRTVGCDCWDWHRGSTLFFWRWPHRQRRLARDGHPVWWLAEPPRSMKLQPGERDPQVREKVQHKLQNVRDKKYIQPGTVSNVTSYFAVPKGISDIRLVYDATRSGLNQCIWVPSFRLPPTEAMTDQLTSTSWMSDHDIGEMFLNFPMHQSIQAYCGIDLKPYLHPDSSQTHIERWVRCMMGWVAAPYVTTQSLALAKETIFGDQWRTDNPYHWVAVVLNLPGQEDYSPNLPWVRRVTSTGDIASDCPTYVDDARIIGSTRAACLAADHRFATIMCYLGIQVAARKVRPPSQTPGAWAGAVALVGPQGVGVTCLPEKWSKVQHIIRETKEELLAGGSLNHKLLEQRRGFLNHIQRVFPAMTPFLKGFHLTLDGWRPGRADDLWKLTDDTAWDALPEPRTQPPDWVQPAPRLLDDLLALELMFQGPIPTVRLIRPTRLGVVIYGLGDASGAGYGSAFANDTTIWYYLGVWGADAEDSSSNFRELRNLTDAIELGVQSGRLQDCELFIFTDNTTAEAAYYKGNSDNRALFELVVRLRRLDMAGGLRLHITHIAGTRMIASGVDGLSRGNLTEGLLLQPTPASFSSFVPLHMSAIQRSPALLPWVQSWVPFGGIQPLSPDDWFVQGHGITGAGSALPDGGWDPELSKHHWFLWDPPPQLPQGLLWRSLARPATSVRT
jgi:hypothetical protein